MSQKQTTNYLFPLIIVFIVCFLIGFITTMNNSMIEFCKEAFQLSDTQGQLVNTFFYGAYFFSIPFAMMMNKIGYKATLVLGLAVVGCGFIANNLGVTAALGTANVYTVFLCCMSIVALGVVMLQLVANPYVMVLGKKESGAFRMTLSQALNSVATTVAPIFITYVIIAGKPKLPENVPGPFLILGIFALVIAAILFFIKSSSSYPIPTWIRRKMLKRQLPMPTSISQAFSSILTYGLVLSPLPCIWVWRLVFPLCCLLTGRRTPTCPALQPITCHCIGVA